MSDSQYRVQVKAIIADIQTNVSQLATGATNPPLVHYSEPMTYPADGPHLAVWYESEQLERVNPTGQRLYDETYQIRYWEPDPNRDADLSVNFDAQNDLENLYRLVLDRYLVGTNQFPDTNNVMSAIIHQAALTPESVQVGDAAFIRGFGAELILRRWRGLT